MSINDFRELKAPIFNGIGWYVVTKVGDASWLTVDGDITSNSSTHRDILYHKTELAAHEAAKDYYHKHKLGYPFFFELNCLIDNIPDDNVESQEMNFGDTT